MATTLAATCTGCQVGYYLQSAKGQWSLWYERVPFTEALNNPEISDTEKNKIRLTQEVKRFAENELGLSPSPNYTTYVHLDRPSVTYVVSAAEKWRLQNYLWSFPIVGSVPYKGYFSESGAREEALDLQTKNLDVYVRGVSAYSTLGYFQDSLLSSMTTYQDHDLVNTIIHETVHTTIYLKGQADFNEKLANFVANEATLLFYRKQAGDNTKILQKIVDERHDEDLFAKFIQAELNQLKMWYETNPEQIESKRQERIEQIQANFTHELAPVLKTDLYQKFPTLKLNNARLLVYKTYLDDVSTLQALLARCQNEIPRFMKTIVQLKDSKNPEQAASLLDCSN